MPSDPEDPEARRLARAHWPIARFRFDEEPPDDLSDVTTAAQRVAMMKELAEAAWRMAGRPLPTYDRSAIPCRIFRPGTPRPDQDDA